MVKGNLAASRRGQCVTNAGLIANILRAPRPELLSNVVKGNLPEQSVILSEQSESKDLRLYVPEYGQRGAKIPRLGFAYSEE